MSEFRNRSFTTPPRTIRSESMVEPKHMLYSVGQDVSLHRTEWKRKIYAIDLAQRVDSISRKSMKIPLNK